MILSSVHGSRSLLGLLIAATLLSCLSSSTPENTPPPVAPSAPFDVSAVMRQVHFAYRPDGQTWRGGHSTYGVKAGTEGLTLTPFAPARAGMEGAPLGLGVMHWNRGGPSVASKASAARLEQTGQLTLTRDGFVEHLRNTEDGLQQGWVFASAPKGSGALVLTQPVKGLAYVGATASGLHFRDERTGLGFLYGHASWVDASGNGTRLEARYVEGAIQFRVPVEVLAATIYPATAAPLVSPEFGMDQPVPAPQNGLHEAPAVASNGSDFLVVWKDFREGTRQIYGTRVSGDGVVLDPWGLDLSRGTGSSGAPQVASLGTDYLVVWTTSSSNESRVMAARVGRDGELLEAAPFAMIDAHAYAPAVTSNATAWFVVWTSSQGVSGARVSSTGAIQDPAGLAITTSANSGGAPAVASNGTDFFVVWEDERSDGVGDIHGKRVSGAGTVLDGQSLVLASGPHSQREPSVASNGTDYLVVWKDTVAESDLFGTRVTSTGTVLDASGLAISTAAGNQSMPSVGSDGTDYFVIWSDRRSSGSAVYGSQVTQAGTVLNEAGQQFATGAFGDTFPVVAFNGTDYLVVWESGVNAFGARVTRAGAILDPAPLFLATSASTQRAPAVASNGTDFLVVWQDSGHGDGSIVGVRVNALGEVLDPSGLLIAPGIDGAAGFDPTVAFNGTDYLVVWSDVVHHGIVGTRVTSTGEIVHPSGRSLTPSTVGSASTPRLTSNGADFLLVFTARTAEGASFLAAARVSGAGELLDDSALHLSETWSGSPEFPAVASNGKDYLIAWAEYQGANGYDLYASRVSSAGAVLDPARLAITTARYDQRAPAVASTGTGYLIVWASFSSRNIPHINGARVTDTGTLLDPAGFVIATERYQRAPAVAAMGTEYFVTWQDNVVSNFDTNIYGARVTEAGIVREPQGIPIAATSDVEETPAVVYPGTGRTALVVYSHEDNTAPYWSYRVRGRTVSFDDNRPPMALGQSASTAEGTPLALTLQASDPDGQSLTYEFVTAPQHGTLTQLGATPTYVPSPHYSGADRFSYRVWDGALYSGVATVTLQVTGVNDAPSVPVLVTPEDGAVVTGGLVTFQWTASKDADGDTVVYDLEILQAGTRVRQYRTAETTWALVANEALPVGSYAWHVSAVDPSGAASGASQERGFTVVAEVPDAGSVDAGSPDAGTVDAGVPDAGVPDAGPREDEQPETSSGCGCNPVAGSTPSAPLLLAGLGVWLRWSRRRRKEDAS